jgi:hypothetical protein
LYQIPQISIEVRKDGNNSIRFFRRFSDKGDASFTVVLVIPPKVIRVEEEKDPASRLMAYLT